MDRALSRLALDRGGPRDHGGDPRRDCWQRCGRISACSSSNASRRFWQTPARALIGHDDAGGASVPARWSRSRRCWCGTAASSPQDIDPELDDTRQLARRGARRGRPGCRPITLQATGIPGLKIKHNNVLGYFIETTTTHADKHAVRDALVETFHSPPDHGQSGALHHLALERDRDADPECRKPCALEIEKRHY